MAISAPKNVAGTLNESTEKLILHGQKMVKLAVTHGDANALSLFLASILLAKSRLGDYSGLISSWKIMGTLPQVGDTLNRPNAVEGDEESVDDTVFDKSITDLNELATAATAQLAEYHSTLVSSCVIHDGESQDWSAPKPYYEGERISPAVQFWGYHMQVTWAKKRKETRTFRSYLTHSFRSDVF